MILDEATSALDVATERRVLRSIIKKEPHRTVIVAAHRPSVFSMCSRVYKVGDGTVKEINEAQLERFLNELYQAASAAASPRYVFPPLFSKKSSSF